MFTGVVGGTDLVSSYPPPLVSVAALKHRQQWKLIHLEQQRLSVFICAPSLLMMMIGRRYMLIYFCSILAKAVFFFFSPRVCV